MNQLHIFKTLNDTQFNKGTALFTGEKAGDNQEYFYNWVANCVARYYEHREVSHLNNAILGCKQRGIAFVAVAKRIGCHNWSVKQQAFSGKMLKGKMDKMIAIDNDDTQLFERILFEWVEKVSATAIADTKSGSKKELTTKQIHARFKTLFTTMGKQGLSLEDMDKEYFEMRKVFEQSMLK